MATVNVYLTFNGNTEEAFNFYKSVFGGEFSYIGKFKDMPQSEDHPPLSPEEGERIMHVSLPISKETILMGSDSTSFSGNVTFGNNFSVSINAGSREEADRLFSGLSNGGKVIMPMETTFWGAYFGMFVDQFGINWMINFDEVPQ
ncbi:VOC family protein [Flavobacterium sp. U410]|jgi:PhnB protein